MRSLVRFQLAPLVKNLRRGLLVAGIAILAGVVVRALGREKAVPTTGGWRELEGPDLR
ncbi:MAG: hypothetical protein AMXMBFR46_28000 [Acidimicrobiia bacterium]